MIVDYEGAARIFLSLRRRPDPATMPHPLYLTVIREIQRRRHRRRTIRFCRPKFQDMKARRIARHQFWYHSRCPYCAGKAVYSHCDEEFYCKTCGREFYL